MKKLQKNSVKKYVVRNIALVILFLALLPALVTGYTQAVAIIPQGGWFTDEATIQPNTFKAGTLLIDASNTSNVNYDSDNNTTNEIIMPGGYVQSLYSIRNAGTKTVYLRAYFEGYWERINHKNVATVTAEASTNGEIVSASDEAYFYYNNSGYVPYAGYGQTNGFTDKDYSIAPFEITFGTFTPSDGSLETENGNNNGGNEVTGCDPADFSTWPQRTLDGTEPPLSGREIEPFIFSGMNPPGDPHPNELNDLGGFPKGCTVIYQAKINNEGDFAGETLKYEIDDDNNWNEVGSYDYADFNFYQNQSNGYASFGTANKNVYYTYAKGGSNGHLYSYFPNGYPSGVSSDCWLTQPKNNYAEGAISHITIYYCEKPAIPSIDIKKYVFLGNYDASGNEVWHHASDGFEMELLQGTIPKFKLVITNTGDVDLADVVVEDDVLDLTNGSKIWTIGSLFVGESRELIIDSNEWWAEQLSTEDVVIELCNSSDPSHPNYIDSEWVPKGPQKLPIYFYHTEKILKNETVGLCVKVYLKNDVEDRYNGSKFVIQSYFEAVQTTNGVILDNWKNDLDKLGINDKFWLP